MAEGYKVTDVIQQDRYSPAGRLVTFYRVSIETDLGARGSIRIPAAEYSKETLGKVLEDLRDTLNLPYEV